MIETSIHIAAEPIPIMSWKIAKAGRGRLGEDTNAKTELLIPLPGNQLLFTISRTSLAYQSMTPKVKKQ
jgi:hypothetical protein